ncbi:DUF4249 family protein [Jiulongibacter sp. NS-SX5]|uniref:DUF4249 family protein n=1 Tax=Jiulongibacter sp. NS-SX5 TaxID=3463854 RepID=UPI004059AC3D
MVGVACVDPYLESFTGTQDIIIVEAVLSDQTLGNFVNLTNSKVGDALSTSYAPITEAKVQLTINSSQTIDLIEVQRGEYRFPEGFRGEEGNEYQLSFTINGEIFQSRLEKMPTPPVIDEIRHEFDATGLKDAEGNESPSQKIYLNTTDPADSKDFYMWKWKLYEQQFWCKTCVDGYYYRDSSTDNLGVCREERFRRGFFDYQCEGQCWEIIEQREVNIMKDEFSNGQVITNRLVANLPIYQLNGSLLEVQQFRISEEAYNYLNLVQSQGQTTGGLADTPPVTLVGNVSSTSNINLPVAGYFIVGAADTELYWLDKRDIPEKTPFLGLLSGGRSPRPEPASADTSRPPMAPCIEGETRTPYKPEGWIN